MKINSILTCSNNNYNNIQNKSNKNVSFGTGFNYASSGFYYEPKHKTPKKQKNTVKILCNVLKLLGLSGAVALGEHKISQEYKRAHYNTELAPLSINNDNYNDFSPAMIKGKVFYYLHDMSPLCYQIVENKGIYEEDLLATEADICLARYALEVANYMKTADYCYSGVKHALLSAGVLDAYSDMPLGDAKNAVKYFDDNKEKFVQEKITADNLNQLPAGRIIVYGCKNHPGHIAITNGLGQEMSDHTGNMQWLKDHKDGWFKAYRLSDKWHYNEQTKKLCFLE